MSTITTIGQDDTTAYRIKSPSVISWNGVDVTFTQNTLIRGSNPIRLAHPELFELARFNYDDLEQATAGPGEKRGRR